MYFDQVEFGKRLRELRKIRGLSQEKMAEELNVSKAHYGAMERGEEGCSIDLIIEIACTCHVSTDYLLMGAKSNREYDLKQLLGIIAQLTEIAQHI